MNNNNDSISDDDDDGASIGKMPQELIQCSICLRRMRPEVFIKHPNVCRKNPVNQRTTNVYDMTKYRSVQTGDKIIPVHKISSNNTIARPSQTRSVKRDRRSDTPIPPIIENFCCPICKRTFCEKAYDRHVTFCTSKVKQIQQTPSEEILLARLKLDRRVKFGTNRILPTLSNPKSTSNKETNPKPMYKNCSISLAHCPWCSKPYIPNCTHYCRNVKDFYPIHS